MKRLLKIKEWIKSFYEKYDRYVLGLVRFSFALIVYLTILYNTGYNPAISSPFVAVGLAVISAFLPAFMVTVLGAGLMTVEFLSVSPEIAVITLIMFVLMLLLYFVFKADFSWILMFTMVLALWGFTPAVLPVALVISPVETIVVAFGVLSYGLAAVVRKDVSALSSGGSTLSAGGRINLLLTDLLSNEYFILLLVTLSASVLLISVVRRSRINHAPLVAIVFGDLLFLISFLLGNYFLDISLDVRGFLIGFILNAAVSFLLITLVLGMDYKRTEEVQFEDDEYYYFVKAIPKVAIPLTMKRREKITTGAGAKENETSGEFDAKQVFVRQEEGRE